ncbi:LacI family DNA-binding transcriptional regulator [Pseudomonas syringae]|uniref:LacI regulatory protein n=1 Tax=Pseudomonas syringae pv. aceris TaxID=199198 RepID=A0A0L8IWU7_PSESX|nr:LacI family DNA-binding transcriptional regulator [Pseudomonas syringae]EGH71985.1 LacI regulatory protein [Pseudomonas syringae pv. aceris str. M302273]KOG06037.1 LacI regulatory protein [Pseudomonas syringae pv. aceris]KPW21634.1 LacI regulatory protein [Pseudomonas syringae pv. aceris]MCH5536047.1 LacI family DNA-binding transcriptional regulator [Pseudomonas syringae pv. syringae]MDF5775224.1 LacI family DNA-binding transcriptional regulator [Pseudomonas syringae pv. syringae]
MLERARHFSIKQLAAQAGVSKATVDRVLHQRGNVHHRTQRRIEQALNELEAQERNGLVVGRTFHIDVIMHTPKRFSSAVKAAIEAQLGSLAPFRIAPRFYFFEEIEPQAMHNELLRCLDRGTQGVVLKAADEPPTLTAVKALKAAGIPVVTLVTDLPHSERIGYVGIDNRIAGQTAAYLLSRWLGNEPQEVAVVIGSETFRGEEEREMGFRNALRGQAAHLQVVEISGGFGVYERTFKRVTEALERYPRLNALYSVGGGNRAIVEAFASLSRPLNVFIGHDLDEENRQLLTQGHITAVINHDLLVDARNIFTYILQYHGLWSAGPVAASAIQIVTPYNLPY